jgi:hypothetical protein
MAELCGRNASTRHRSSSLLWGPSPTPRPGVPRTPISPSVPFSISSLRRVRSSSPPSGCVRVPSLVRGLPGRLGCRSRGVRGARGGVDSGDRRGEAGSGAVVRWTVRQRFEQIMRTGTTDGVTMKDRSQDTPDAARAREPLPGQSRPTAPNHQPALVPSLLADPLVELQDSTVTRQYRAREVFGDEKALWWRRAVGAFRATPAPSSRSTARSPSSCSNGHRERGHPLISGGRGRR